MAILLLQKCFDAELGSGSVMLFADPTIVEPRRQPLALCLAGRTIRSQYLVVQRLANVSLALRPPLCLGAVQAPLEPVALQ